MLNCCRQIEDVQKYGEEIWEIRERNTGNTGKYGKYGEEIQEIQGNTRNTGKYVEGAEMCLQQTLVVLAHYPEIACLTLAGKQIKTEQTPNK